MPVRKTSLENEGFHKKEYLDLKELTTDADFVFFFWSAIKRNIFLSG